MADWLRFDQQLTSPPRRNFVRVAHADQVHHSCRSDKSRPVVSRRARHIRPRGLKKSRELIKYPGAGIGEESECAEQVAPARRKDVAAQKISRHCEPPYRNKKHNRAPPPPQQQMPHPWDNPCCHHDQNCCGALLGGGFGPSGARPGVASARLPNQLGPALASPS